LRAVGLQHPARCIAAQGGQRLAHDVRKDATCDDALVVVGWHHGNIPNMMHAVTAADGCPDPWDHDVSCGSTFIMTAHLR
jgi:hypothetical protein